MGLVFAELIIRTPYIAVSSDKEGEAGQVALICQAVGTPTEENWPGVTQLPTYMVPSPPSPLQPREHYLAMFGTAGSEGVDLLMNMLVLDPRKRITAKEVLEHEWWRKEPKPTRKEDLPRKAGGESKMGEDLKRRPGVLDDERGPKVARKLDFGTKK